jgi:hypothetical protein
LPPGTEELPERLRADIARLIPRTEELRGLSFVEAPSIRVLTADELAADVIGQVVEDYEDVEADQALYRMLGLIPPEFGLLDQLKALYGEQIAGYYDGENKELVVTARQDDFTPLEETTLVHELTHALVDQHHDYAARLQGMFDADQFDRGSAFQALGEGDASLVQTLLAQQMTPAEQQQYLEEAFAIDTSVIDRMPRFIRDSLTFPYDAGTAFATSLWQTGGFAAVDSALDDPPVSTEQIITPSDYRQDLPVEIDVPDQSIDGYLLAYGSTWGELGFRLMFDQILGGNDRAAGGWKGDGYDLYFNGTDALLVLVYEGEAEADASELADALGDYFTVVSGISEPTLEASGAGSTYQADDYAFVSRSGNRVVMVVSGDPAAGLTARGWYPEF